MQARPEWWDFKAVLSPHVIERMEDRGFSEIDLREMLDDAQGYRPSIMPGRFVITTVAASQNWEVVVEPDELEKILIIVTAYRIE